MKKTFLTTLALGLLSVMICSCSSKGNSELSGSGATFPEPFYNLIFNKYQQSSGNLVSYSGVGSGTGIRNLKDKVVDFAGSDAFLSDEEMKDMDAVVHVPTCMGAVVLAFKLNGINDIRLSGEVIADIYDGKITKWDDKRIQDLNPTLSLPNKDIIPVYRADGSGTTFVFTSYLSSVSQSWKEKYGAGKSVDFAVGQAGKGNPGVAGLVSQTEGAIGYVGSEYAFAQKINYATLQNSNGEFVKPNKESISLAAAGDIPQDTRVMIVNSNVKGAYPIALFTWLVVYKEQSYDNRTEEQAKAVVDLLQYILGTQAQALTTSVNYAPLPQKAIDISLNNIKQITYKGKPILK